MDDNTFWPLCSSFLAETIHFTRKCAEMAHTSIPGCDHPRNVRLRATYGVPTGVGVGEVAGVAYPLEDPSVVRGGPSGGMAELGSPISTPKVLRPESWKTNVPAAAIRIAPTPV